MVDIGSLFGKSDKHNQWISRGEQAYDKGLYDDAAQHFTKALELEPGTANLWTRLGTSQRLNQKYDAAARSYAKAVQLNPSDFQAWTSLALILGDAGKYEEAISAISHVVLTESEAYLKDRKCEWLERSGKYKEAGEICSLLLSASPGNKQYRIRYAELLMRSGDFAKAKTLYDELSSDGDPGMIANAGFCCEMTGDADGALKRYANLPADDSLGWYHRARLEESLGNFKNASAAYGIVQQHSTAENVTIIVRRALSLYWEGNGIEAAVQLEKVISKGYANAELWYMLGTISFLNGSFGRAGEAFLEYSHLNQTNTAVWYMKGCAEYLSGKYKDALDSFERMNKLGGGKASPAKMKWFEDEDLGLLDSASSPKEQVKVEVGVVNEGLLSMQGFALAALGRYNEADKTAGVVLSHSPSRLDMELLHSRCLAGLGRYQYAADAAARVLAKSPNDMAALELHAASMMLTGKYKEAAGSWNKLVELAPENTLAYTGLLKACSGTGRYTEAKEIAEHLLHEDRNPHNLTTTLLAGDAAFSAGLYEESVTHYRNAAEISPNTPAAFIGLGLAYEMLGEYENAAEAFTSADGVLPD
ncbi:MAG: tetratricopeptide repeat protein, partial [Methanocorpusculum sp.]|nr:tetratricopeptide repeat protein [Methanocorpusculum sp.]